MTNKTAVEHLYKALVNGQYFIGNDVFQAYNKAKQMDKEQMIKFAQIVLNKAECSHTGMVYIEEDIEDIYNETYNVKDN
jgi:hypothetical protein